MNKVTKKILLIGYVLGVLLFAGFAKAESQTNLEIRHISYQEGSWMIEVSGDLRNPCLTSPQPTLVPSRNEANTLILQVQATQTGDFCAQAIAGSYHFKVDLRLLMQKAGVLIVPQQTYTVKTEKYPFEVSFKGGDVMSIAPMNGVGENVTLVGVLTSTSQGQIAVITEQNKIVLLDDSGVDSAPFMNKKVSLVGRYGPLQGNDERSLNPFRNQSTLPILPIHRLMVTEINQVR